MGVAATRYAIYQEFVRDLKRADMHFPFERMPSTVYMHGDDMLRWVQATPELDQLLSVAHDFTGGRCGLLILPAIRGDEEADVAHLHRMERHARVHSMRVQWVDSLEQIR